VGVKPERSIYNAMLRLIENAQHFVYIENQYFCAGFGEVVNDDFGEDEGEGEGEGGGEGEGDEEGKPTSTSAKRSM
jgi:hypothetical protein